MMHDQHHAPGGPCWVTLAKADPQAVVPFYQWLFGWDATWADGTVDMSPDLGDGRRHDVVVGARQEQQRGA